jgi:hypothetical protein
MTETDTSFKSLRLKPAELPPPPAPASRRPPTALPHGRRRPFCGNQARSRSGGALGGEESRPIPDQASGSRGPNRVSQEEAQATRPRGPQINTRTHTCSRSPPEARPSSPPPPSNAHPAEAIPQKAPRPRGPPRVGGGARAHRPASRRPPATPRPPSAPAAQLNPGEVPARAPPSARGKPRPTPSRAAA